jgi:phospholipid/cholesterol/gamma-HCH transport system ATP-binding protein
MSTPEAPSYAGSLAVEPAAPGIIVFENVSLAFGENRVLEDISFHLEPGETKILLGVAGTGKTLILKLALGLLKPDRGRIQMLGKDITAMREEELFALRRRIGMVFQESALFDSLTVKENVGYRLIEEGAPDEEVVARVREALRFVELENTINMFPSELSGGMRRRVAIARAIINQPEVLLYDSPTAGLDPITSTTIIELVVKQRDVYHTSALMVTHRLQDAFIMASHCFDKQANRMRPLEKGERIEVNVSFLILRDAKVIFDGTAVELAHSRDEYIREYLS